MAAHRLGSGRPGLFGVLYAEDFDDDGLRDQPLATPEPEVIEPVFTAAEVEAAREEGRAAGRMEAERGLAGSRNQLLALLADGVAAAREAAQEVAEDAAEAAARCMLSALTACLPRLCERHGEAELRALARHLLPALRDEPRITVRVNPHMLRAMADEVAGLDPDLAERVQLVPTDAVAPGDARVSWAEGSATRDTARAIRALEDGLAELGLFTRELVDA